MSQTRNRNSKFQLDAGDALPMGAFRPHPTWFEEHWLIEAPPAPPGAIRQRFVRLFSLVGALF